MTDAAPQRDEPEPAQPASPPATRGGRRRAVWRWTRRVLALVLAIVAAAFVMLFTIDIGRFGRIKDEAEKRASTFLNRPMTIGRISAHLRPGVFVLDDIRIAGLKPEDRPFFTAKRIKVSVPWWTLFNKQLHVTVEMTDWKMVVESWGKVHNVPNLKPKPSTEPRPKLPFTTTVDYVYASGGEFLYEDHGTPWRVTAPNLNVAVVRATGLQQYVGLAEFSKGTVAIQHYEPMHAALRTNFRIEGGRVALPFIDLRTDGAHSRVAGEVNFANWPEQTYKVDSVVQFPRMREIFFAKESWRLSGEGRFLGTFRLFKGGGRDLSGTFTSEVAGVNDLRFGNLRGALEWLPKRFAVSDATADFAGGKAAFDYTLEPLGTPGGATATFETQYDDLDVRQLIALFGVKGLEPRSRASGELAMTWPNGRMSSGRRGEGATSLTPPAGVALASPRLPPALPRPPATDKQVAPPPLGAFPAGGDLSYMFDPDGFTFTDSWVATPTSYISFRGRIAGQTAEIPFHVTSMDWQESDRLLAGIMTAMNASTDPIAVGGRGTFDGRMTGSFRAPRIAGTFAGDTMRVWDVTWGDARGDIVIENRYLDITNGVIGDEAGGRAIHANGRFSLGIGRKDGGEEINARISVIDWPLEDLKRAFNLVDWPVDGIVTMPTLELKGAYKTPTGTGQLLLEEGVAWRETFDRATATLTFDGKGGISLDGIDLLKLPGQITGAAYLSWAPGAERYFFTAEGFRIPVESLTNFKLPAAPLTGLLRFKATGSGSFDAPYYEVDGTILDLYAGEEGIGQVNARFSLKNKDLTIHTLTATSSRLEVTGAGRISLDEHYDSDLQFRFLKSSLDPYLKLIQPDIPDFTRAIVSGSARVAGSLADRSQLLVTTEVDEAVLTLFDYELRNDGPLRLAYENGTVSIAPSPTQTPGEAPSLRFRGTDTELQLTGSVNTTGRTIDLTAQGQANLAILQGFYPQLTTSGATKLIASLKGTFDAPDLTGTAVIVDGRLRHRSMPQGPEHINGTIAFGASGISLDGLTAEMGGGRIAFGGAISRTGFKFDEFNLIATGYDMRLRYPRGFTSTADVSLALVGPTSAPELRGTVLVRSATFSFEIETDLGVLGLAGGGGGGGLAAGAAEPPPATEPDAFPMMLNIDIQTPGPVRIAKKDATIRATADFHVAGTFAAPLVTGWVDMDGSEIHFAGNRYFIRQGRIEWTDPVKFEPTLDIEAETRVRAASQWYTVTARFTGPMTRFAFRADSEPWLPQTQILGLLLGQQAVDTTELAELRSPQAQQGWLLQNAGAMILTGMVSSRVGSVFERTTIIDRFDITPLIGASLQRFDAGARLTVGKRLSNRAYLTYSRAYGVSLQDEIIVLEYDQTDRLSWILSRNQDRTFALDFRIRHVF